MEVGSSIGVSGSVDVYVENTGDGMLNVDAGLDQMKVGNLSGQPFKLEAGLDHVRVGNVEGQPFELDAGLSDIRVKELPTLELKITEIPRVRAHVPQHYDLSIRVFGFEVLCFSLCGESQVITEPYVARRAETCR